VGGNHSSKFLDRKGKLEDSLPKTKKPGPTPAIQLGEGGGSEEEEKGGTGD